MLWWRKTLVILLLWTAVLAVGGFFLARSLFFRRVTYSLVRTAIRSETLARIKNFPQLTGRHFILRYPPGEETEARLVLTDAESIRGAVDRRLGYTPPGRVLLILEPTERAFRQAFDWGPSEEALGAYYEGAIWLLAPSAWVGSDDPAVEAGIFRREGPLAHEYTHLVLDYETAGNFPRWYTEGLAQYEEKRVNGYQWIEPDNNLINERLYTMSELRGNFYGLPNQALAYREALGLVSYLASRGGSAGLARLDRYLGRGLTFSQALKKEYRLDYAGLWNGFLGYLRRHPWQWMS